MGGNPFSYFPSSPPNWWYGYFSGEPGQLLGLVFAICLTNKKQQQHMKQWLFILPALFLSCERESTNNNQQTQPIPTMTFTAGKFSTPLYDELGIYPSNQSGYCILYGQNNSSEFLQIQLPIALLGGAYNYALSTPKQFSFFVNWYNGSYYPYITVNDTLNEHVTLTINAAYGLYSGTFQGNVYSTLADSVVPITGSFRNLAFGSMLSAPENISLCIDLTN